MSPSPATAIAAAPATSAPRTPAAAIPATATAVREPAPAPPRAMVLLGGEAVGTCVAGSNGGGSGGGGGAAAAAAACEAAVALLCSALRGSAAASITACPMTPAAAAAFAVPARVAPPDAPDSGWDKAVVATVAAGLLAPGPEPAVSWREAEGRTTSGRARRSSSRSWAVRTTASSCMRFSGPGPSGPQ